MSKKNSTGNKSAPRNPVAKHAHRFNRSAVFTDKTRYSRKTKHKGQDPVPMTIVAAGIGTGSCFKAVVGKVQLAITSF